MIEQGTGLSTESSDVTVRISQDGQMAWLTCKTTIKMSNHEETEFESWQTNVFEKLGGVWNLVLGNASNLEHQ